ncbi:uncharacterized protein LOC142764843 [Rhipicephalus microplus]|uniref:uncharacterized protein LOC142764843 n=1 Tax=Rhipicephalus microplus TaxID=6941 RepID=UPI003F6C73D1
MRPNEPRSPSPQEEGLHSTEQLLPGHSQVQRSPPWKKAYRAASADDKADLAVVGLLAGMLLAGVFIGALFLPKGSNEPQTEALKAKNKLPSVHTMPKTIATGSPTTDSTPNKNEAKIKTDRRDDEQPETTDEEVAQQTNDAEETTTPPAEERGASDSEKKSKGHRKRKTT